MDLAPTVRPPETTSGRKTTVSGLTSGRPLTSVALCTGLLATTRRLRTLRDADGRFHPNRKWKYCGSRLNVLAIHDFLFDFNTIYGLTATVWPLETTSGLGATENGDIRPCLTSKRTLTVCSGPDEATSGLRKLLPVGRLPFPV